VSAVASFQRLRPPSAWKRRERPCRCTPDRRGRSLTVEKEVGENHMNEYHEPIKAWQRAPTAISARFGLLVILAFCALPLSKCLARNHQAGASCVYTWRTKIPNRSCQPIRPTELECYTPDNEAANQHPKGNQNACAFFGGGLLPKPSRSIPRWLEATMLIAGAALSGMLGKRVWEALHQESLFLRVSVVLTLLLSIAITLCLLKILWLFL